MASVMMIEIDANATQVNMPDSTQSPLRIQRLLNNTAQRNRPRQLQVETRLLVMVLEKEPVNKIPPCGKWMALDILGSIQGVRTMSDVEI